ncbi:hypothetical protein HanRHA438_Chr09g0379521 [Helianthus annuus]|nr:hypothetical protein HanRHA438_Chr09g0379521 [Helianthus annuus]
MIVSECGASLLYMDDGEVVEKEYCDNNTMKKEEVIGGDLSEFEVTTGGYYLSRRDIFGPETSSRLKAFFDDNVNYPESHGWRKTRQSRTKITSTIGLSIGVGCNNGSLMSILKEVSKLAGIYSLYAASGSLSVHGDVDLVSVARRVRNVDNMAEILSVTPYSLQSLLETFEHI